MRKNTSVKAPYCFKIQGQIHDIFHLVQSSFGGMELHSGGSLLAMNKGNESISDR